MRVIGVPFRTLLVFYPSWDEGDCVREVGGFGRGGRPWL